LFRAPTGEHLRSDGALHRAFRVARLAADRPDLTFHDLRHTGATLAALPKCRRVSRSRR